LTRTQKFKDKFSGVFSGGMSNFSDKIPAKLKSRRVLIVIAFIILVIIVYLFIGGGSGSSFSRSSTPINANIKPVQAPMTAAQVHQINATGSMAKPTGFGGQTLSPMQQIQPMAAPVATSAPPVQPVNIANEFSVKPPAAVVTTPASAVTGVSKEQLAAALDRLSAQWRAASNQQMQALANEANQQAVSLTQQNQQLSNQLTALQQQMAALTSEMTSSQKNIKDLQTKVGDIVKGYVGSFNANGAVTYNNVPKPLPASAMVMPAVSYVVQAIVPGRAWLYGSNGQTISVGVGDKIENYGNVMNIDSLTGTVTMSNGAVLKPGA